MRRLRLKAQRLAKFNGRRCYGWVKLTQPQQPLAAPTTPGARERETPPSCRHRAMRPGTGLGMATAAQSVPHTEPCVAMGSCPSCRNRPGTMTGEAEAWLHTLCLIVSSRAEWQTLPSLPRPPVESIIAAVVNSARRGVGNMGLLQTRPVLARGYSALGP